MDLGKNLENAFNYAKQMVTDAGRWIILIILNIIPIVNFIALGYFARVIKETPSSGTPPKLERYGDMWVQGLKIVVALLIYMIVPLIIFGVGIAALVASGIGLGMLPWMPGMGPSAMAWPVWIGIAGLFIVVGIIVAFLVAIIATIGIAHMIKQDRFSKAFAFGEITGIVKRVGWGSYILWLIVIFVISLVFGAIGNIPWIGWLITLILTPPFGVFVSRSLGLVYEGYEHTEVQAVTVTGEVKYCIQCGSSMPKQGEYCPKCGAKQ